MHDGRLHAAQQPDQVQERHQVADRVDTTAESGHNDEVHARQSAGFLREESAGAGHQHRMKSGAIEMGNRIQRDFLRAT